MPLLVLRSLIVALKQCLPSGPLTSSVERTKDSDEGERRLAQLLRGASTPRFPEPSHRVCCINDHRVSSPKNESLLREHRIASLRGQARARDHLFWLSDEAAVHWVLIAMPLHSKSVLR